MHLHVALHRAKLLTRRRVLAGKQPRQVLHARLARQAQRPRALAEELAGRLARARVVVLAALGDRLLVVLLLGLGLADLADRQHAVTARSSTDSPNAQVWGPRNAHRRTALSAVVMGLPGPRCDDVRPCTLRNVAHRDLDPTVQSGAGGAKRRTARDWVSADRRSAKVPLVLVGAKAGVSRVRGVVGVALRAGTGTGPEPPAPSGAIGSAGTGGGAWCRRDRRERHRSGCEARHLLARVSLPNAPLASS